MGRITVGRVQTATTEPDAYAVIDPSGQEYEPTITGDGFGPTLNATDLAKGQRTSGGMVFDTEPAARHGKIVTLDWLDQPRTVATWTY
jgi:hypothetical protein